MLPFIRRIAGDVPLFVPTIQDNERAMNGEELAKLLAEGRGPAITQPAQRLSLALKEAASLFPPKTRQAPRPVVRLLVFARRVLYPSPANAGTGACLEGRGKGLGRVVN